MKTSEKPKITRNNVLVKWHKGFIEQVENSSFDMRLKERRKQGIDKVFSMAVGYLLMGFTFPVVSTIALKKANLVLDAYSQKEIDAILKFSTSEKDAYYIPEEELLMLCVAKRHGQLTVAAQQRFLQLYEKCLKEKIHE